MNNKWFKFEYKTCELQLKGTLNGGQSFRWKTSNKTINGQQQDLWTGVFHGKLWILKDLKGVPNSSNKFLYQVYDCGNDCSESDCNKLLSEYFRLDVNLKEHYTEWSKKDPIFQKAAEDFYGIRVLNQDVVENIFSFICSSNNNISRITQMVEKLALNFGEKICEVSGESYYSFPKVQTLAGSQVESFLRKEGFGYRAKYISEAAKLIVKEGGDVWINELKKLPYEDAKNKLMTLSGIGPKVADCICLMSLGHLGAIPVDTHVYQIARNFYMPTLPKRKSVTTIIYKQIGDHFRDLYGPLAGWAQTVLFCADLKKFQLEK